MISGENRFTSIGLSNLRMKKLFIVDAVNLLFRSYYGIGPMTNQRGEPTQALFGFIRSIYKLIEQFSPDLIVAVFDGPDNKRSRLNLYAEYKSHRQSMPRELLDQLKKAIKWCQLAGIPLLLVPEVEADDTMGSVAVWAEKNQMKIFLCSSDKDLCQLVTDNIFIVNVHKENSVLDKKAVKTLYGITPKQMVDYLAIIGDQSDNIPGLKGIGPKTAVALLEKFGTLEKILANTDKISNLRHKKIIEQGEKVARLSQQLATIRKDVEFPKEVSFFYFQDPCLDQLRAFYREAHFLSFLKETEVKTVTSYQLIADIKSLETVIKDLFSEKEVCFDTETTDIRPMLAKMIGMGISNKSGGRWYIPLNTDLPRTEIIKLLKKLFSHKDISFFGHDVKYDLHLLKNEGLPLPQISFDTLLASYLLHPHHKRHHLDQLSLEILDINKTPIEAFIGKGKNQLSMDDLPIEKIANHCCENLDCTTQLKCFFESKLHELNLISVLKEIELPLMPVLMSMERRGIYVDLIQMKKISSEITNTIDEIEKQIHSLAGEKFNISSPKQLSKILFEKMGIPHPKKKGTQFSTNAATLEALKGESPIVEKILLYRTFEKLRSTYIDTLPLEINQKTKRIHCTFHQSVAATGRLSCQNPNLQNVPVRTEEGKKIRAAFKPEKDSWSFLSADYSQIELRLLAHLSEDPALLKAFREGEDIHAYTASLVFGIPLNDVTKEMRYKAKAVNFGILYGQQPFGLSKGLKIDYKEAVSFIETYFQRYKKVRDFFEFCKESVRKTGRAVTMTGRHRPIPEINSDDPILRSAAERLAINTPLQGTAADLIKIVMIQIQDYFEKNHHPAFMLLQIHDELLFEAPDSSIATLSKRIKAMMEGVMVLKIPLEVQVSVGKNWGQC